MAQKTVDQRIPSRPIPRASAEEILERIFLDLARTDPRDTGELLRALGAALQIASTAVPNATSDRREVWNEQERETFRSRKTWESWILRQKCPSLGDRE